MGPGLSDTSAPAGAKPERSTPLRRLGHALALSLVGPAPLALPGSGAADPVTYLAWLALAAPAVGYLAAVRGVGLVPFGLAVPGVWLLVLTTLEGRGRVHLPTPFFGALVVAGLFAGGASLGALSRCRRANRGPDGGASGWAGAGVLLLLAALAAGLPGRGGAPGKPLQPGLARALLDVSPASLALESAGVDWMRDPAVYDPVGTDRFQRVPYRGALAGPMALLVGCLSALLAEALCRRASREPCP